MTPGIARRVLELFKVNLQLSTTITTSSTQEKSPATTGGRKSYKMIASELFISQETVKSHVSNIYGKLHVHSATEAVALAIRNKIV